LAGLEGAIVGDWVGTVGGAVVGAVVGALVGAVVAGVVGGEFGGVVGGAVCPAVGELVCPVVGEVVGVVVGCVVGGVVGWDAPTSTPVEVGRTERGVLGLAPGLTAGVVMPVCGTRSLVAGCLRGLAWSRMAMVVAETAMIAAASPASTTQDCPGRPGGSGEAAGTVAGWLSAATLVGASSTKAGATTPSAT
jgi:hypothetical protein